MRYRERSATPVVDSLAAPAETRQRQRPHTGPTAPAGRALECDSRSLSLLLESIAEVTSTIDLDRLLVNIVDKSIELTGAERGMLLLSEPSDRALNLRVARDSERCDLPADTRYSTRVVFEVQTTGEPLCTLMTSDEEALRVSHSIHDMGIRTVMCTPLVAGDRSLGLIYVDSRLVRGEFSSADLALFEALSRQIAIALTNARLVRESLDKTRLEQSLQIAADIQAGLLPQQAPEVKCVEIFGWQLPYEIASGDYYDFLPLPRGRLAVVVGDVSGHGIGAALISATARATLRAYLRAAPNLSEAVTRLNRDLADDLSDDMFLTLFVAVVDPESSLLQYVNAGHPPPQLICADGTAERLDATGMALGILQGERFAAQPVELSPGDLLFAYSDGITEARGPEGVIFGERRLRNVIRQLRNRPCKQIVTDVARVVELYQSERPTDDRTAVAMKYLGKAGPATRPGIRRVFG